MRIRQREMFKTHARGLNSLAKREVERKKDIHTTHSRENEIQQQQHNSPSNVVTRAII